MDFTLSEEQILFRDSVARLLAERYPFERRQAAVATPPGYDPEQWARFAELGWLAAPFPPEYGGLGGSSLEVMLLMEQLGRHLVPAPVLSTVVLGGHLVLFAGDEAQKRSLLPALCEGGVKLACAFAEPGSRYALAEVRTSARRDGAGFRLDGEKRAAYHAQTADRLLVTARTGGGPTEEEGVSAFLVEPGARGLETRHHRTYDGGRVSHLRLDGVRVAADALIGPIDAALPAVERVVDHAVAALCAEACGAMWAVFERTLEYLKTRRQFGQTLGSFQALQHRMVDVYTSCELARSMVYEATLGLADPDPRSRARRVAGAKYALDGYATEVGKEGVQLHGAVGMTWDLPVGHYLKRIVAIGSTFGDRDHQLARYRALAG